MVLAGFDSGLGQEFKLRGSVIEDYRSVVWMNIFLHIFSVFVGACSNEAQSYPFCKKRQNLC